MQLRYDTAGHLRALPYIVTRLLRFSKQFLLNSPRIIFQCPCTIASSKQAVIAALRFTSVRMHRPRTYFTGTQNRRSVLIIKTAEAAGQCPTASTKERETRATKTDWDASLELLVVGTHTVKGPFHRTKQSLGGEGLRDVIEGSERHGLHTVRNCRTSRQVDDRNTDGIDAVR
jgi:hypothetical protein